MSPVAAYYLGYVVGIVSALWMVWLWRKGCKRKEADPGAMPSDREAR